MPLNTVSSTSYLVEQAIIDSIKEEITLIPALEIDQHLDHFHSDSPNGWPLISVKAVLAEEEASQIVVAGQPCEVYNVFIVAEWPITEEEAGVKVSASQLQKLSREIWKGLKGAGAATSLDEFTYFEIEPFTEAEKDVEEDAQETPTRRVDITSFQCIVIRAVDA